MFFFGAMFLHQVDWVARNQLPLEYVPSIESFASSFRDLPLRFDWWISLTGFFGFDLGHDLLGIYMYIYIYRAPRVFRAPQICMICKVGLSS